MRSLKQVSFMSIASSIQPTEGGNDNRAKVKNDGSGHQPKYICSRSASQKRKAAAREVSYGSVGLFPPYASHFRFTPRNRHLQIRLACLKRANIWLRANESA